MDINIAAKTLSEKMKVKPVKGIDMGSYYVIYAVPPYAKPGEDYDDALYAVDKNSGKCFVYTPLGEMDKFSEAAKKAVTF